MPPAELWLQFTIIGIIVLVVSALGLGLVKIFHELTAWQDQQDQKREAERERQRKWQDDLTNRQEAATDRREERHQQAYKDLIAVVTNDLRSIHEEIEDHHRLAEKIDRKIDQITTPLPRRSRYPAPGKGGD